MAKTRPAADGEGDGAEAAGLAASEAPSAESASAGADLGTDFAAASLAAVAQANAALIEGVEDIGKALYDYARDSFASAASAARSLIEARSLVDVVAVNRDFAQTALEGLLANSARVSEIGLRATSEALKPLGERVADTITKASRPTNL